jgi:NAD(P)-dependent dehydrogenase (short-subunit alcohol dehydrogenase family)
VNPVSLVTGASRGIGRGIALALAGLGHDLILHCARNIAAAEETAAQCLQTASGYGHSIATRICAADLSRPEERTRLASFTRDAFGGLDLLVNNAGAAPAVRADVLDTTEESLDHLMAINLKGPFFLTQELARWMLDDLERARHAGRHPQPPQIVFVSSISAYTASLNRADYCLSKAALAMVTPLFALRLADAGINVYELRPGLIETDMTAAVHPAYSERIANGLTPIRRWGTPEDVGRAVAAIAQRHLPFSTGEIINVDGGFHLRRF